MIFEFQGKDVVVQRANHIIPSSLETPLEILVPGSKSLTNRFLLLGGLAKGSSVLENALDCEDSRAMSQALRQLGCQVEWQERNLVVQAPERLAVPRAPVGTPQGSPTIFVENAGTAMRFLMAACGLMSTPITLDGNQHMRRRPQGDLVAALQQLGAQVSCLENPGCPPIEICGPIQAGHIRLKAHISSQYLSALLMVLPLCAGNSRIELDGPLVSRTYIEMTLNCLKHCGVRVDADSNLSGFQIPGSQAIRNFKIDIEPDASTASYWFALPAMVQGTILMKHVPETSDQGDWGLLDLLRKMGIKVLPKGLETRVSSSSFGGIEVNMNSMSDVAPTLAVIATQANSPTMITDVGNMRVKECDRISVLQKAFDQLGLQMKSGPDWIQIIPGLKSEEKTGLVVLDPHDDHRMAMVFTLLGLRYGNVVVKNYACVAKTYPHFFKEFSRFLG